MGNIDWNASAEAIERLIRGLNSWPSAYTHWENKVVKIWSAKVSKEQTKAQPGTVTDVTKTVFCADRRWNFNRTGIADSGKEENEDRCILRGYHLEEGTLFHS